MVEGPPLEKGDLLCSLNQQSLITPFIKLQIFGKYSGCQIHSSLRAVGPMGQRQGSRLFALRSSSLFNLEP